MGCAASNNAVAKQPNTASSEEIEQEQENEQEQEQEQAQEQEQEQQGSAQAQADQPVASGDANKIITDIESSQVSGKSINISRWLLK